MPPDNQPPPAYVASTEASPILSKPQQSTLEYNTFLQNRIEQEHRVPSQSMGRPVDPPNTDDRNTLWRTQRLRQSSHSRIIIKALLAVALMLAILTSLTSMFHQRRTHPGHRDGSPPGQSPIQDGNPYCPFVARKEQSVYEITAPTGLVVIQDFYNDDRSHYMQHVKTSGIVHIQKLAKNSERGDKPHFTVDVRVSDPKLEVLKSWDVEKGTLRVSTPLHENLDSGRPACIALEITAWLPEGTELSQFVLDLVTLSIMSDEDIDIKVSSGTLLKTVSGHVKFAPDSASSADFPIMYESDIPVRNKARFNSRHITVETASGRIEGTYPIYDLLKLSSVSGAISVDIYPEAVLDSAPAPATLDINTSSGRIEVGSPIRDPSATYPREYVTRVKSTSGAIQGDFFVGPVGTFHTTSGRIQLFIKPVMPATMDDDDNRQNVFRTESISGATQVTLLEPAFILPSMAVQGLSELTADSDIELYKSKLRTFFSSHQSTSGRLEIHYPPQWIGHIAATTLSGRIEVSGEGVEVIKRDNGWVHKKLEARKGVERDEDGGRVTMETVNSAIVFDITR
ncbi:hypothetical protein CJF30_00006935 [Rutstroemia sp. NJR-2017a BBW]|nr:hypothetical protein CJF30_00006935 [Rutstroemia sp. NJR-2017a BBW]